jgi:hypothetical protein
MFSINSTNLVTQTDSSPTTNLKTIRQLVNPHPKNFLNRVVQENPKQKRTLLVITGMAATIFLGINWAAYHYFNREHVVQKEDGDLALPTLPKITDENCKDATCDLLDPTCKEHAKIILGLSSEDSMEDKCKSGFRKQMLKYHPDKNKGEIAAQACSRVTQAKEIFCPNAGSS